MYEYYLSQADRAESLAHAYFLSHDYSMFTFWASAADGYRIKANNLTVGEAE